MTFRTGTRLAVMLVAGWTIVTSGCMQDTAFSRLEKAVPLARAAALSSPELSEEARSRISKDHPKIAAHVEFVAAWDSYYVWTVDEGSEVVVHYIGEPSENSGPPVVSVRKVVARKNY